ncbi:nicotinate-nucleotide--dimethylbenzimidazole phosphoribosyltransferase [Streptomyces sp. B15]|uniref:nicotinate-nucleotide--dimethylbenzimidazole phosphoribosyltransferase n=1 Tax=Streptomyces sp. B15 TaxID=1537797 RepID=UPI001B35A241|nr:nicotinate-nucleotide--dimethylbenzimidazole phosphoribosyltransferase [Streptomyces sp. B15]MBQ1122077.1 nicotinate-nucleotide--dimethylbenzimidazole phosphoribosyltransferase [Streptomyces sp. B15]
MTDTGQIPGEGLPENAGGQQPEGQPGVPASGTYAFTDPAGGVGDVQAVQDAAQAPSAHAPHGHHDVQSHVVAQEQPEPHEEEDLLLMPSAQGAWNEQPAPGQGQPMPQAHPQARPEAPYGYEYDAHGQPQPVAGQQAPPDGQLTPQTPYAPEGGQLPGDAYAVNGHAQHGYDPQEAAYAQHAQGAPQPSPQADQPDQPQPDAGAAPAAQPEAEGEAVPGPHETDGRDSGSLDVSAVRTPQQPHGAPASTPGTPGQQSAPGQGARRPLHLGPPVPEQSGTVRPLSERAAAQAAPAAPQAAPVQGAPTTLPGAQPVAAPSDGRLPAEQAEQAPAPQDATGAGRQPTAPAVMDPQNAAAPAPEQPAEQAADTPAPESQPQPRPEDQQPGDGRPAQATEAAQAPAAPQSEAQPQEPAQPQAQQVTAPVAEEPLPGPQLGQLPPQQDGWVTQPAAVQSDPAVPTEPTPQDATAAAAAPAPAPEDGLTDPAPQDPAATTPGAAPEAVPAEAVPEELPAPAQEEPVNETVPGPRQEAQPGGLPTVPSQGGEPEPQQGAVAPPSVAPPINQATEAHDGSQPDSPVIPEQATASDSPGTASEAQPGEEPEPMPAPEAAAPAPDAQPEAPETPPETAVTPESAAGAEAPSAASDDTDPETSAVETDAPEVANAEEAAATGDVPEAEAAPAPAPAEAEPEAAGGQASPAATDGPATDGGTTGAEATEADSIEAESARVEADATEPTATEPTATEATVTEPTPTEATVTEPTTTEAPEAGATEGEEVAQAGPTSTEAPNAEAAEAVAAAEAPAPEGEAADTAAADTEAPATEAPATETPATDAPATEAPATAPADAEAADAGSAPVEAPAPVGDPAPGYAEAEREAVHRLMRERRDIRNGFRPDPIPHEVLLRVLEAAHTAPSVGHSQPWDFVVIRSEETRRTMHELAERQRQAYAKSLPKGRAKQFKEMKIEAILDTPVNIVVTADPTRGGRHTLGRQTQPQMAPYSSALAVENLWLAARAEGLGVGWVSFFDERELVRALELPEHLEVVAYLCVGYVDEFPDEPELMQAGWSKRRPLSWVVHEESYGRRALPGAEPTGMLAETLGTIRPLDAKALGEAWERQKRMTKPSGALGMLEIISAQLCGLSRKCPPPVPEPAAVAVFAGDHGVHAQGVTPWPQEVTAQMVTNFLDGGAVCNAFANQVGAEVCVVDVGVAAELPTTPGLLPRKVRAGTADMTAGPALTQEEVERALEVGIETARDLVAAGNKALLTGEMGIANTTASAALIAACTGADPTEVTGRGTGINDETHARKVEVVRRALELHQPDPADPLGMLSAFGGLEHAAMVGLILGGASLRTPVILDGVSAGAAALVARAVAPEALAACIAGHRSAEPGHVAALTKLGLRPLVDLDLRLGEGTGALLALPMVQSAARAMHEVATFDAAGVTEKS